MINKVIFQGRMTRDPELKSTNTGKHVCSFSLAQTEKYGNTEQTLFLDCVAWEKSAEFVCKHFAKGQEMLVEGRLTQRNWQDKEGGNRKSTEVRVDQVHFCGSKASAGQAREYDRERYERRSPFNDGDFKPAAENDDLPF